MVFWQWTLLEQPLLNLGTEAAAKTISIGIYDSATVDANALIIEFHSAGGVINNSVTTTAFTSGTTMTLSSGGILAIDTSGTAAINFGTEAVARTITIGNDATAKVHVNCFRLLKSGFWWYTHYY